MTVGYGDKVPKEPLGSFITVILIVSSVMYMAMPLGIIGAAFTKIWKERDCILLVQRTRKQMDQWGYGPFDMPMLFDSFDSDKDGELDLKDFQNMIETMHIGLSTERAIELFETFDADGGGSIDALEFVRWVFHAALKKFM